MDLVIVVELVGKIRLMVILIVVDLEYLRDVFMELNVGLSMV